MLGNLIYIMQVTWGDVTGLLLWVFKMLSDHPEWRDRLAREQSRELATRIVQETLRLEQSESVSPSDGGPSSSMASGSRSTGSCACVREPSGRISIS